VEVNRFQRKKVVSKPRRALHTWQGKRIALLVHSFEPNTDDLKEAPSLEIASALDFLGTRAVGYDPVAGKAATEKLPSLKVVFDLCDALEGAHAAVIVTEWREICSLGLKRAAALTEKPKVLVDGRNVLNPREIRAAGIRYRGFGRGYGLGRGWSQEEAGDACWSAHMVRRLERRVRNLKFRWPRTRGEFLFAGEEPLYGRAGR